MFCRQSGDLHVQSHLFRGTNDVSLSFALIKGRKLIMHVRSTTNPAPEPQMVPRIAKEAHKESKLPWPLKNLKKGKKDKRKIVEMVGPKASVLGMVKYERDQDFLLVYDSQHFSFSACMFVV